MLLFGHPVAQTFSSFFFFLSLIAFSNFCKSQEGAREVKEVFWYTLLKNTVCIFGKDRSKFISSTSSLFSGLYFLFCVITAESPSCRVQEVLDYTQSLVSVFVGGRFHFPFVAVFLQSLSPFILFCMEWYIYGFLISLFSSSSSSRVMTGMTGLQNQRGR